MATRVAREDDLPAIAELERRVPPYLPEREVDVKAMFVRAEAADGRGDPLWRSPPDDDGVPPWEKCTGLWVVDDPGGERLAGVVGGAALIGAELPDAAGFGREWRRAGDVAELVHLRVAPERQRMRIGSALCEEVISWAAGAGFTRLVVNTTTPQLPALALYRRLGFADVGVTYVGRYELVGLERAL